MLAGLRILTRHTDRTLSRCSRRAGPPDAGRGVRRNHPAVWQDLAHVVKYDHPVAQQAPPLLGVKCHSTGGVVIRAISGRARGPVRTHCAPPVWAGDGSCEDVTSWHYGRHHSKVPVPVESFAAEPARRCRRDRRWAPCSTVIWGRPARTSIRPTRPVCSEVPGRRPAPTYRRRPAADRAPRPPAPLGRRRSASRIPPAVRGRRSRGRLSASRYTDQNPAANLGIA